MAVIWFVLSSTPQYGNTWGLITSYSITYFSFSLWTDKTAPLLDELHLHPLLLLEQLEIIPKVVWLRFRHIISRMCNWKVPLEPILLCLVSISFGQILPLFCNFVIYCFYTLIYHIIGIRVSVQIKRALRDAKILVLVRRREILLRLWLIKHFYYKL